MSEHHITAPLYIDLGGALIETEARFVIDAEWDGRDLIGCTATLTEWFCNDEWRPRAKLESVLTACGDHHGKLLKAAEEAVLPDWCETVWQDMADARADSREWLAAE